MNNYTITIYYFLEDYLKISSNKEDFKCKISDAELLTTVILAARYFCGNYVTVCLYMENHQRMEKLDKSNFNRHLHRLSAFLLCSHYEK
jgi:hypothetical protein